MEERTQKIISVDFDGVVMGLFLGRLWIPIRLAPKDNPIRKMGILEQSGEVISTLFASVFRKIKPGTVESLNEIKKQGYTLYLLTARDISVKKITDSWIKSKGLEQTFTKNIYNYSNLFGIEFKVDEIKNNNIDIHIDDNSDTVEFLSKTLPDKLFIYFKYPYERHIIANNVKEARSWTEIVNILKTII